MKNLKDIIQERLHITKNTGKQTYNYHPKSRSELKELVYKLVKERGNDADLNDIDTSNITDMTGLFDNSYFNGDISRWNVSKVKSMRAMFYCSEFTGENGDISKWNMTNVEDISYMFHTSKFNGNLSNWNVNNIEEKKYVFINSPLEKNPPKWYKE